MANVPNADKLFPVYFKTKTMAILSLSQNEKTQLLQLARETITTCFAPSLSRHHMEDCIKTKWDKYNTLNIPITKEELSCFVTLNSYISGKKQLRGCIGTLEPRKHESLLENIISNSIMAAFHDSRFEPLQKEELKHIQIEISILSTPVPINYQNKHELFEKINGKGVIIQSGYHRATFLPQVWEQLPQPEDFLKHLSRKADIFSEDYLTASYEVYEVYAFEEGNFL